MQPIITVFTPTYNRAYCLHRCYESMKRQTCKDFIWLIIDDGSTDNTKEIVEKWLLEEKEFEIRYIYKENGGMHTGYNTAYQNIDTELSMNIDSDDYLTDDAIEKIIAFWIKNGNEDCGGIYALDRYENGKIIGEPFPDDLKSFRGWGSKYILYDVKGKRKIHKAVGDKKFIAVTRKIKQYPEIPVFEGEKYYSLYYKQHFIERDYTILIMNEPVCVVEYMNDGSSKNMFYQYINNPRGFISQRKYILENAPLARLRFIAAVHYVAESLILRNKNFIEEAPDKPIIILAIPMGIALYALIKCKTREGRKERV